MSHHPTCCGQPRQSRFCPDCGKKIATSPLVELLDHCRRTAKYARVRVERSGKIAANVVEKRREIFSRKIRNLAATAEKWQAWADALAALMDAQCVLPPDQPSQ